MKQVSKKKILFNLKANQKEGLGHFYRCISIAKEFLESETIFLCSQQDKIFVSRILDNRYKLFSYDKSDLYSTIKKLKPDLLINDVLSTTRKFIKTIRELGIKVINFEDLGSGARFTNLTINEIYEEKLIKGDNILWGKGYFFLRDEFGKKIMSKEFTNLDNLLLTFGGSDQHNLSKKIFLLIREICRDKSIHITIVTGPAYNHSNLVDLEKIISKDEQVDLISSTGYMARIMEKVQLAISSNGRTVYELAHMNVPAIVICQHQRESKHTFANKRNGFINLGIYKEKETEKNVLKYLSKIIQSKDIKTSLFKSVRNISFKGNKQKVLKLIRDEL